MVERMFTEREVADAVLNYDKGCKEEKENFLKRALDIDVTPKYHEPLVFVFEVKLPKGNKIGIDYPSYDDFYAILRRGLEITPKEQRPAIKGMSYNGGAQRDRILSVSNREGGLVQKFRDLTDPR